MTILYTLYLLGILSILYYFQKIHVSFNKRVFFALVFGGLTGAFMQYVHSQADINKIINIYQIVSESYVRFLQMLIYPIVVIATLTAMTKLGEKFNAGKTLFYIIFILLLTTAIAAIVGIGTSLFLHIDLSSLDKIAGMHQEVLDNLHSKQSILNRPLYTQITDFITINPFADLTGSRPNSIASIVIFCIIVGAAYLGVKRKDPETALKFKTGTDVLYKIVMRVITLVLRLTPYGIFAIFCKITATTDINALLHLLSFVLASYIAIIIMFIIHLSMLAIFKINPIKYLVNALPLLSFAFVSRSSAASIPLNIKIQTKNMGVSEATASLSSSFGAILGQNGCAGIYPAMLAIIVAPSVGIDYLSIHFLLTLVAVIVISSFGIAGIGGGATFAALAVLGTFNMPISIVILLLGIEPLIDMARTALNVNGSMTASLITAKALKELDMNVFNSNNTDNGAIDE